LADTTCTQALWQQVTGNNPSHFKGEPDLPVESVSWDDVTKQFLRRLNRQLTEVEVFLPTEAQWEYACRAGADTAFHFGNETTKSLVNANGAGMAEVKKTPPNRWGLYQMHGNVWEWCADARRPYAGAAVTVTDPDGGRQGHIDRAVRGGAWLYEAKKARCASRNGYSRNFPSTDIGFRFALRSAEPDSPSR
jgi:formylglycine-generating enzyme required for sulfatase activity